LAFGTTAQPRHLRGSTGFVDEDQALRIELRPGPATRPVPRGDVEPVLLGCDGSKSLVHCGWPSHDWDGAP
jgi:hypothetical protein